MQRFITLAIHLSNIYTRARKRGLSELAVTLTGIQNLEPIVYAQMELGYAAIYGLCLIYPTTAPPYRA